MALRSGSDYNDPDVFDIHSYLQACYNMDNNPYMNVLLDFFHEMAEDNGHHIQGKRLLDIGTGPSIASIISAGRFCEEIVCSDFAEQNRRAILKWMRGDPEAFDWSGSIKYIVEREGSGEAWEGRQERIRGSIKDVLSCDVHVDNPLAPTALEPFDIITSSLCLEAACANPEAYVQAVKNVASLLKTGGHLCMMGVLGQNYYAVGKQVFYSLPLSRSLIESALSAAGLKDFMWSESDLEGFDPVDIEGGCDASGLFAIRARKI